MRSSCLIVALLCASSVPSCVMPDPAVQRELDAYWAETERREQLQAGVGQRCILRPVDLNDQSSAIPCAIHLADLQSFEALLSAGDLPAVDDYQEQGRIVALPLDSEGTVIDAYQTSHYNAVRHWKLVRLSDGGAELWVSSIHCRRFGT